MLGTCKSSVTDRKVDATSLDKESDVSMRSFTARNHGPTCRACLDIGNKTGTYG